MSCMHGFVALCIYSYSANPQNLFALARKDSVSVYNWKAWKEMVRILIYSFMSWLLTILCCGSITVDGPFYAMFSDEILNVPVIVGRPAVEYTTANIAILVSW